MHEMEKTERLVTVFGSAHDPLAGGKYVHWDELKRLEPPGDLSHREWWCGMKSARQSLYEQVALTDRFGGMFQYLVVDPIPERLHQIDLGAGGLIQMPEQITNPDSRDRYYVRSLIEEAITSSQLEGAATTRKVAKEMIRAGRQPRGRSERMILNNFLTMRRISELKDSPLTKELVLEICRLVADRALDDPSAAGRFRRDDERVIIDDVYGEVFHEPPPASQLEDRMAAMCDFANGKTPSTFMHPAVRSIILHFWLSYDHPFVDGNGRTARALFYWSMLHNHYWLFEFVSISQIIRRGPAKYGRAFLYTETDDNDLTYFILYHLDVIHRAVRELHEYLRRKAKQLRLLESELRGVVALNHRQRALIGHALRHPHQLYTVQSHQLSHNVVHQTARTDLLDLVQRELLQAEKVGRSWRFTPAAAMEEKLGKLS